MMSVTGDSLAEVWRKALFALMGGGLAKDPELVRDDVLVACVKAPLFGERFDADFPMLRETMEEYNRYIVCGGGLGNVLDEHALYHERIFCFPPNCTNQIDAVVAKLSQNPYSKRAQISFWNPDLDPERRKVPCIQVMWFRIVDGKLVMHVHMRACDAYKKFLMNLNICAEIMDFVAKKLNVPCGEYLHFVDSFHIYKEDFSSVQKLKSVGSQV